MKINFGLAGLSAAELHGNLTQLQRLDALEAFRDAKVNFLLATDLASRGLDIIGMQTVINYTMPSTEAVYVHRVGRTARAGKKGRAVSLVGETGHERTLLKLIVKHSYQNSCKHRIVPADPIKMWREKIENMSQSIKEVISLEKEEKAMRVAEMEAEKLTNIIKYKDEIVSRPARSWFISEHEKKRIKSETKKSLEVEAETNPEPKQSEEQQSEGPKPKVYIPAKIPSIKRVSRREKRKKEDTVLTPDQYQLAKKRNKGGGKEKLKRQRTRDEIATTQPSKKLKVAPSAEKDTAGTPFRKKQKAKNFKSKSKYKRRR